MDPVISEIKYLGGGTLDFVEVRIPDDYPDPENLVLVIYDRADNGSSSATPAAADMFAIESVGDTSDDTDADGFTHYIVGTAFNGTAIRLHAQDAVGLYNAATGETYGLYSFGTPYTVSTAALQPDGTTADPFAGQATTVLPTNAAVGDSLVANGDGTYSPVTTPTPGSSFLCFCDGTHILAENGLVRVEDLQVGDRVLVKGGGFKPIRWIGSRWFDLSGDPSSKLRPIRIAKGALGRGLPKRDLLVSPNHCVLVTHFVCELLFAETNILVAAKHLLGMAGVEISDRTDFGYFHILFDTHELIDANGTWAESLFFGDVAYSAMGRETRAELLQIFPELNSAAAGLQTCAPIISNYEASVLRMQLS